FKQPMFLAFGPDGAFYVSDWENSRVERFDADRHATNAWPLPTHAWGIAVDDAGRVFAPDGDHHLVRMFAPDGGLLAEIGAAASQAIPLDGVSQVGLSPDDNWLWVLGNNGLARVDLRPFAGLRPTAPVRVPLLVLGGVLVLIGIAGTLVPHRVRVAMPRRAA